MHIWVVDRYRTQLAACNQYIYNHLDDDYIYIYMYDLINELITGPPWSQSTVGHGVLPLLFTRCGLRYNHQNMCASART